ncbi:hypothetical protein PHMEG_00010228 [Phytophthora megakarya]|uniref:Uncharacterized protein n=1 Tax=Phytophthora megakarya TaxID=4795 RepID=A0A225WFK4_9STRA|nr:hypothetical protein PHMEG_00010228 [Phytophthora megakarya]
MPPGDVLTVIPIEEIRSKGIPFVVAKLSIKGATWNVNEYVISEVDMQTRTNFPLESYNRRVKQAAGKHPALLVFLEKVKDEAARCLQILDNIDMHRRLEPPHADPVTLAILGDYTAFKHP